MKSITNHKHNVTMFIILIPFILMLLVFYHNKVETEINELYEMVERLEGEVY